MHGGKLADGDPEQPRTRGIVVRAIARAAAQGGEERIGDDVGSSVGVCSATCDKAQQRVHVPAIEDGERVSGLIAIAEELGVTAGIQPVLKRCRACAAVGAAALSTSLRGIVTGLNRRCRSVCDEVIAHRGGRSA
jgi:hypothetical protein